MVSSRNVTLPTSNGSQEQRIKLNVVKFALLIHLLKELTNLLDTQSDALFCCQLHHPLTSSVGV